MEHVFTFHRGDYAPMSFKNGRYFYESFDILSSFLSNKLENRDLERLLKPTIEDGDKVKWVYLRQNPLGLETVAFKDYNDPKEIMDFVEQYVDRDMIFKAELENKIDDFYTALKWDKATTETKTAKKFFAF